MYQIIYKASVNHQSAGLSVQCNSVVLTEHLQHHCHVRSRHRKCVETCSQALFQAPVSLWPLNLCSTSNTWSSFPLSCSQEVYAAISLFSSDRYGSSSHMYASFFLFLFCSLHNTDVLFNLEEEVKMLFFQSFDLAMTQHLLIFSEHLLDVKYRYRKLVNKAVSRTNKALVLMEFICLWRRQMNNIISNTGSAMKIKNNNNVIECKWRQ